MELTSTLPDSYFADHPLERVKVETVKLVDAKGAAVSQFKSGQQVTIASSFRNQQNKEQAYAFIVQITDKDGFVVDLGWQTGKVLTGQTVQPSRSWTVAEPGTYTIKVFMWDKVTNRPVPLSDMTSIVVRAT